MKNLMPTTWRPTLAATLLFILASCFAPIAIVQAGTASRHPFAELQPDNVTSVTLYIRGDEDYSYYVDEDGYTVVRDLESGWLVYAEDGTDGGLVPSGIRVGQSSPTKSGMRRGLMPSDEHLERLRCGGSTDCDEWDFNHHASNRHLRTRTSMLQLSSNIRTSGTFTNLVVLLRFAHSKQTKTTLPTRQQISILMNAKMPDAQVVPTGSVYSAYREYSYGKVDIQSSITPWIRVKRTEKQSSDRGSFKKALWQALHQLKRRVRIDARNYDAVTVLHSGYGAEHGGADCYGTKSEDRVWAHSGSIQWMGQSIRYGVSSALWGNGASCGTEIARIGMIAHEIGHSIFRLPDLYDRGRGSGAGAFDLMAYAWGKDNSQRYPPHPSAWTKIKLSWIVPTTIQKAGQYALYPTETNPLVYRIDGGYPKDEYLLIEFRIDIGFDRALGCGGAIIYHIDDTAPRQSRPGFPRLRGPVQWPMNGDHYQVAIAQSDRRFDLEKGDNTGECEDLWGRLDVSDDLFGPGGNIFSTYSYPNSDSYRDGIIRETGIRIYDFQKKGRQLKFAISGPHLGSTDRPTTRSEDEQNDAVKKRGANNKNSKNCKDDKDYVYRSSSATYNCAYAKDNKHVCRRKDPTTGMPLWHYCRCACRSLFLSGKHKTDICPSPKDVCAS